MKRSGEIAAVMVLLGLLAGLLASAAEAAEPLFVEATDPGSAIEVAAAGSTLRLADMPAGFVVEEEGAYCREAQTAREEEGIYEQEEHRAPTPAEAFVAATRTSICPVEYRRLYRAPGTGATPLTVTSFTLVTPSAKAAAEGLAIGPELFEYTLYVGGFEGSGAAPPVGEEARAFDTRRGHFRDLSNLPGTLILWRQGAAIGGVYVEAMKAGVADAAAASFAARQQAYVLAPRPYLLAEAEDIPTFLENPNLKVPIWWLGPTFEPKGFRSTFFLGAYGSEESGRPLPGLELSVDYFNFLKLDTWTRPGWAKFSRTPTGRRQWSWHCTRSRTLKLPHGHAVIYGSYRKDEATCPSRPPEHFSAHVFLPGIVIAIGEASNRYSGGEGDGLYESERGLEAIARSLRRYP